MWLKTDLQIKAIMSQEWHFGCAGYKLHCRLPHKTVLFIDCRNPFIFYNMCLSDFCCALFSATINIILNNSFFVVISALRFGLLFSKKVRFLLLDLHLRWTIKCRCFEELHANVRICICTQALPLDIWRWLRNCPGPNLCILRTFMSPH